MEWLADVTVVLETGSELVSGSTRMKAGTAQKIALNMLTTTAMIRLGNVHDGYMIGVQPTSEKLRERAVRIVSEIANVDPQEAIRELEKSEWDTKIAIIIIKEGITPKEAKKKLDDAGGILRRVLEEKK
jgi:N-acetylmuramic acid 6-phosphate etherase